MFTNDLIENIEKLHTTKLGTERIKKNLSLKNNDVVSWCKERILDPSTSIERRGKNWYAAANDCIITVNAHSHTIITAHRKGVKPRKEEERDMPFTEICIYQVKPQKVEEFEALMLEAERFLEKQEGLLLLRLIKRGYRIDMEQIKEGLPPLKIKRVVKSVKYMLYWEFDTKESYGAAQKNLYDTYWKSIEKCLLVPHDKYLGEALF